MRYFNIVLIFLAVLAIPALAQKGAFAEPAGAELQRFPIKTRPLTVAEQAELGLTAKKLEKPTVVQNHFRNLRSKEGRFVLEMLPAGTIVLADQGGKLRYKADCGNRLVEMTKCPVCPIPPIAGAGGVQNPGAWSRFWNAGERAWGNTWEGLGSVLGTLFPILIVLALLCALGYVIARAIRNRRQAQVEPATPQQPAAAPTQVAVPAASPTPPQQAQAAAAAAGAGSSTSSTAPRQFTILAPAGVRIQSNPIPGGTEIRFS